MANTELDLDDILNSDLAERVAARLTGNLSETEEPVWGSDFAASGTGKQPPSPPVPPT